MHKPNPTPWHTICTIEAQRGRFQTILEGGPRTQNHTIILDFRPTGFRQRSVCDVGSKHVRTSVYPVREKARQTRS